MGNSPPGHTRTRGQPPGRTAAARWYGWLALGVFVLAVYGSLIPFRFRPLPLDEALAAFARIELYDPANLGARGDWVISIVLYLALTYLVMAALCVDRPRRWTLWVAAAVVPGVVCLSVAIEFVQVYFPPRTVSLNDIAVESLGGVAGVILWLIAGRRTTAWFRRLGATTGLAGLAKRLFPGYLAALFVVTLMPFDFTAGLAELAQKYREGKVWLLPFARWGPDGLAAGLGKALANAACFFPLGLLRALAAGRGTDRGGWRPVVLLGLGVTGAVEGLQLLVYSRVCDTTDILTGTAAVCLGWQAGRAVWDRLARTVAPSGAAFGTPASLSWPPSVWAALALTWLAAVAYFNWSPFDFTADPVRLAGEAEDARPMSPWQRLSWLPFVDYYWGSKYQALDQFLKKACSFVPLGVLAALWLQELYRPGVVWRVLLVALAVAAVLEVGQCWLPRRVPSVTDVLLACSGALLAFLLARRARVILWAEATFGGAAEVFRGR